MIASENAAIHYTINNIDNRKFHLFIRPEDTKQLSAVMDTIATVKVDAKNMALLNAFNITSITDEGTGSMFVAFASPVDPNKVAAHSLSASTTIASITANGAKITFDESKTNIVEVLFAPKNVAHEAFVIEAKPRRYSEAESARRLAIYDQLYEILNGTCSAALDLGSRTGANWENQIVNSGSSAYIRKLKEFREVANNALQEISRVLKRYEYFSDIQSMFQDTWGEFQKVLWEAIQELIQTLQPPFVEKPESVVAHLVEPRVAKFMNGVHLFGEWITETNAAIAAKIKELGRD